MDRRRFLAGGLAASALVVRSERRGWQGGLIVPPAATPPAQSDERFESVAALLQQKMADVKVPGVALGVVKDGRTLTRGFGVANIEDPEPFNAALFDFFMRADQGRVAPRDPRSLASGILGYRK